MIKFGSKEMTEQFASFTKKLGDAMGESALRKGAVAGAAIFRDEAKQNALANKKTGTIYNNIIIKHLPETSFEGQRQEYLVTVRTGKYNTEGDAFYWRFVEEGHKFVRRGQAKKDTLKKRRVEALEFGTALTPAYPFMRPAYESKKQQVVEAVAERVMAEIADALK